MNSLIGKKVRRVDAVAKVTGKAKYTDDYFERDMLIGKILGSPYAHAHIKHIDTSRALALPGVEAVLTYDNVPHFLFPTAGHLYALDPAKQDRADRFILTDKARFVGDAVAAVVATDEIIGKEALKLIEVEYEPLEPLLSPEAALKASAPSVHESCPQNILSAKGFEMGNTEEEIAGSDYIFEGDFATSIVQHCQLENQISYAYLDPDGRITIVSSTQIPHIVRRIVGQALGIPWGKIRVIKPYVGGGFGNKQDVCFEPLNAAMTLAVGGRPVKINLTREECMIFTRTRHAFQFHIKTGVSKEGILNASHISALSNTGAYASHGHSIAGSAGSKFRYLYPMKGLTWEPKTVYTNLPVAGAMRGYGTPQIFFAFESHLDDIARKLSLDPVEIRLKNLVQAGHVDPLSQNAILTCGIRECIAKGKELIRWDEKRALYREQTGFLRRGVGMACFSYASGTYPVNQEIGGARIVMNQDGSVQLQIGATEIGQGSDTVFCQMVGEILGLPLYRVHVISTQDTDLSPFDPGSFASRQTYVSGMAVKKAAEEIKAKLLSFVFDMTQIDPALLDLKGGHIVYKDTEESLMPIEEAAMQSYYDLLAAQPITSDVTCNVRVNAIPFGATFAEVEVDLLTGKIDVLEIYNIHDSGRIINPQTAEGQVHGGVSMALGYALSEQLLFDEKTGKPLNNNLLDYKLPTVLDTPDIGVAFVEEPDPTGAFGVKALGEPPVISPAPAIRNAVLHATGIAFNRLPLNPQRVFEALKSAGLI